MNNRLFQIISQYFWLICIGVTVINFILMDRQDESDSNIDRAQRRRYLAWLWGLGALPWLVVGYGQITGNIASVWALFRPQDGNPYVWAFYVTGFLLYLVMAWWVFFRDGARIAEEMRLMKYQAPGRSGVVSAFWIKVIALAGLPFFAFWLWVMSRMNVPMMP